MRLSKSLHQISPQYFITDRSKSVLQLWLSVLLSTGVKFSAVPSYCVYITKTRPCNILQSFTVAKKSIFRCIFAQNIDCGYTLEPPH